MDYFDKDISRLGTYCTQWDYIGDRFGVENLLPFSISDTDFRVPEVVNDALRKRVEHGIYGYTRWNHKDYLSSIISYYDIRHNTPVNESWIAYSPSVMYSISKLFEIILKKEDYVATFTPMYDAFIKCIKNNNNHMLPIKLEDNEINWQEFEDAMQKSKVLLLCSPHNPTGKVFTGDELNKIIRICKNNDVWIISDEIHSDIILAGTHIPILNYIDIYEKIILVSSASKTFNTASLGGSYVLIPNHNLYNSFLEISRNRDFVNSANIMGITAQMVSYREGLDYIDELVKIIQRNMKLLSEFIKTEIPEFSFIPPQATYLAWIDTRNSGYSMKEIQKVFINVGGLGIMDGSVYGKAGEGFLRMNIACPLSKLEEGLKRMRVSIEVLRRNQVDTRETLSNY